MSLSPDIQWNFLAPLMRLTRENFCIIFVPLAYKIRLYCGDEAIVKNFYNIDIVILICCSMSLLTHSERLSNLNVGSSNLSARTRIINPFV